MWVARNRATLLPVSRRALFDRPAVGGLCQRLGQAQRTPSLTEDEIRRPKPTYRRPSVCEPPTSSRYPHFRITIAHEVSQGNARPYLVDHPLNVEIGPDLSSEVASPQHIVLPASRVARFSGVSESRQSALMVSFTDRRPGSTATATGGCFGDGRNGALRSFSTRRAGGRLLMAVYRASRLPWHALCGAQESWVNRWRIWR
jgi:hypothetical protein